MIARIVPLDHDRPLEVLTARDVDRPQRELVSLAMPTGREGVLLDPDQARALAAALVAAADRVDDPRPPLRRYASVDEAFLARDGEV